MFSNKEIKKLLFWKRLFEDVGCKGAVLVLTKRNEDILSNIVKYIPFVMKNNMYVSLLLHRRNNSRFYL